MRAPLYRFGPVVSLFLLLGVQSPLVLAQTPAPASPACSGDIAVVRVSTIKPGMMAAFMKAQEAHKAWYKSHGFPNHQIYAAKILTQDLTTKQWQYSDTELMTFHVTDSLAEPKHDAAWDAYVKQYRDSSDIKSMSVICMPKVK